MRNKSLNATKTSKALRFYYTQAKNAGVVDQITSHGSFLESAIKTAILRGSLSQKMLDSFVNVLNMDPGILTGEKELPVIISEDVLMTDHEMQQMLEYVVTTKQIGSCTKKNAVIQTIKALLKQF